MSYSWKKVGEDIGRGFIISVAFLVFTLSIVYAAISWPSAPTGETTGGKFMSYLSKMLVNSDIATTDGKVKSAASADDLSWGAEAIVISQYSATPGPRNEVLTMSAWNNIWTKGLIWNTAINTSPTNFTYNGNGTITVAKAGLYQIRETGLYQPSAVSSEVAHYCPYINWTAVCPWGTNHSHTYATPGYWYAQDHGGIVQLSAGAIVSYGIYPIASYLYWAHDNMTTLTITRIR